MIICAINRPLGTVNRHPTGILSDSVLSPRIRLLNYHADFKGGWPAGGVSEGRRTVSTSGCRGRSGPRRHSVPVGVDYRPTSCAARCLVIEVAVWSTPGNHALLYPHLSNYLLKLLFFNVLTRIFQFARAYGRLFRVHGHGGLQAN